MVNFLSGMRFRITVILLCSASFGFLWKLNNDDNFWITFRGVLALIFYLTVFLVTLIVPLFKLIIIMNRHKMEDNYIYKIEFYNDHFIEYMPSLTRTIGYLGITDLKKTKTGFRFKYGIYNDLRPFTLIGMRQSFYCKICSSYISPEIKGEIYYLLTQKGSVRKYD